MFEFSEVYKSLLTRVALMESIYFIKIYVDDLNQGRHLVPYRDGKLYRPGIGWSGRSYNRKALTKEQIGEIEERSL